MIFTNSFAHETLNFSLFFIFSLSSLSCTCVQGFGKFFRKPQQPRRNPLKVFFFSIENLNFYNSPNADLRAIWFCINTLQRHSSSSTARRGKGGELQTSQKLVLLEKLFFSSLFFFLVNLKLLEEHKQWIS